MFTSGNSIGTSGGHADPRNGLSDVFAHAVDADMVVDGVDSARRAVRFMVSRAFLFAASAAVAVSSPATSRLRATGLRARSAARRPASRSESGMKSAVP